jgi:hypothetical protein
MHRLLPAALLVVLFFCRALFAAVPPEPSLLAALTALEARASKENTYPDANPEFHQEVVRLVESNTLASGDDFFRAASLATGPIEEYRSVRMRYELMLAAAAKGYAAAGQALPAAWDSLLVRLGRPMRFDAFGLVAGNPDHEEFQLNPAPTAIQTIYHDPAAARKSAAGATDNPEVQKIVDADQATRAGWNKLSQADLLVVMTEDHRRNVRIREIVNEGTLHTAKDFANAALVLQHSAGFAGYQLAHELAVCSLLLGDRGMGRWLVAATYDRMLNSLGHDQRFGTQGALTMGHEKPMLRETDEAGICDAERLALGCPTLAAKRANFYAPHPAN